MDITTKIPRYLQRSNQLTGAIRDEMLGRLEAGDVDPAEFRDLCKELLQAGIAGGLDLRKEVLAMSAWVRLEEDRLSGAVPQAQAPAAFLKILERKQA